MSNKLTPVERVRSQLDFLEYTALFGLTAFFTQFWPWYVSLLVAVAFRMFASILSAYRRESRNGRATVVN